MKEFSKVFQRYFQGNNYIKLEFIVTIVQYGINGDVYWYVSDGLGAYFDRNSYGITLIIDKVIELDFSGITFEVCNYVKIEGLVAWVQDSINADVGWCISGWLGTGFYGHIDAITLFIDEEIELGFSDI